MHLRAAASNLGVNFGGIRGSGNSLKNSLRREATVLGSYSDRSTEPALLYNAFRASICDLTAAKRYRPSCSKADV